MSARDRAVWLEYFALLKGGLGDIGIDQPDVRPTDLLADFYGPLIEHLTRTHRVEIFPRLAALGARGGGSSSRCGSKACCPRPSARASRTWWRTRWAAPVARAMIADGGAGGSALRRMSALPGAAGC